MPTTPYIINDEKRLTAAGFGRGAIVVITDDCMVELLPVRYGRCEDPTICLQISSEVSLDDVRNKMPRGEIDDMLEAFQEEMPNHGPLTPKGLTRPEWKSWAAAAKTLRLLATIAEARSAELKPEADAR